MAAVAQQLDELLRYLTNRPRPQRDDHVARLRNRSQSRGHPIEAWLDVDPPGHRPLDRLRELGYGDRVQGVHFNERCLYPDVYLNKRAEIIIELAKWLNGGDVRIPDDDEVHADFACIPLDKEKIGRAHV